MNEFHVRQNIVITTKHNAISIKPILLVLIALVGSICTFSVCFSMIHFEEYNKMLFWTVTCLSVLSTSIFSLMPKKMHFIGYVPLFIGILLVFWKRAPFISGFKYIYNLYYCVAHHTETQFFELKSTLSIDTDVLWFICCTSIILCSLIARVVIRKPYFIFYFLLTFIPIEFGLYEGLKMNIPSILILVVTWFCVLSIQIASYSRSGKKILQNANMANCGIAMLAVTVAAVLTSVMLCNAFNLTTDKKIQNKRDEMRENIENFKWEDFVKSVNNIGISLGLINDPDTRKLGTKSNIKYRNEDNVQITLSEPINQSLYLKNFTGSIYEDNKWESLPEDEWQKNEELNVLFTKFECVPQILPFMNNQNIYGEDTNAFIKIKSLQKSEPTLLPYAAYEKNYSYLHDTGCSVGKNKDEYSYSISLMQNFYNISSMPMNHYYLPTNGFNFNDPSTAEFFSNLDIDTSQESIYVSSLNSPYIENSKYKAQALQASLTESYAYRQFVHDTYTVPFSSEGLDKVYASLPQGVYEAADSEDTLNILAAIRKYLSDTSEYTLSPGETPSTRDFVNYFLLENNKGYCMHFATAGAVIARYFGIPTRYCEGYIVSADMIASGDKSDDGSIVINIPDSSSHAWCEYYIDGYGWVPYELTPGYYDTNAELDQTEIVDEENNIDTDVQTETSEIIATTTITTTVTTITDYAPDNTTTLTTENNKPSNETKSTSGIFETLFKVILYIIIAIAVVAVVIYGFILSRNYVLKKRKDAFNNPNTIMSIISIYEFLMILLKYQSITPQNEQLLDFAEIAENKLNSIGIDGKGANDIIKLALAADMGGKEPSKADIESSVKYVNSIADELAKDKNIFTYLVMKYIYHFF